MGVTPTTTHSLPPQADLVSYPAPRAFADAFLAGVTGTLTLTHQQLEKHVIIRKGIPVHTTSNLASEGLGHFLASRGELKEELAIQALSRAVAEDKDIGGVLVEMGALSPHDLFRAMRRVFGTCILDTFRWTAGTIGFDSREPDVEGRILLKVEPALLVLRGMATISSMETIQHLLPGDAAIAYQVLPGRLASTRGLKLNATESRIARALASPRTIAGLAAEAGIDEDQGRRFVAALTLLEVVATAGAIQSERQTAESKAASPEPQTTGRALSAPTVTSLTPQEEAVIDAAYLSAKAGDYFQVLGVTRLATVPELRVAFLTRCETLSPAAYRNRDLGDTEDRLEELFFLLVRAYSTLCDVQQREAYVARMARASSKKESAQQVANPFAIQTDILDAKTHLRDGTKQLNARSFKQALLHFEFAQQLEPNNPEVLAYLGYCLFTMDAERNRERAVEHLEHALKLRPNYAEGHFMLGRVLEVIKERELALRSYESCLTCDANHAGAKASANRLRHVLETTRR